MVDFITSPWVFPGSVPRPVPGRGGGRGTKGRQAPSPGLRGGPSPGRHGEEERGRHGTARHGSVCLGSRRLGVQPVPRSAAMSGQVQLDSRPILPPTDGNENFTEVDAFDIRQSLDPAVEYKMNHQRRGVALIFNHEYFFWQLKMYGRPGTMADKHNLERSFTDLGFEVRSFDNLKADEMRQKIREASVEDHSNADCFVCVFLSHGEDDHIYAYDGKIKIQTITDMFRGNQCQSLVGKPKIFIFQACRGDKHDDAVIAYDSTDSKESLGNETEVDAAGIYTLPAGADFIMCYSVAQGYYSYRDTSNGSWYIQDLCEILRKHGSSLEFTELLTLVNRKVSHRRVDRCQNPDVIGKKQIPCFASMLTKKLYFHPKSK